tara:strand:- start:46701 stop:49136 length:2436 start_codon:yes stop_codon:yes gene_type:complete
MTDNVKSTISKLFGDKLTSAGSTSDATATLLKTPDANGDAVNSAKKLFETGGKPGDAAQQVLASQKAADAPEEHHFTDGPLNNIQASCGSLNNQQDLNPVHQPNAQVKPITTEDLKGKSLDEQKQVCNERKQALVDAHSDQTETAKQLQDITINTHKLVGVAGPNAFKDPYFGDFKQLTDLQATTKAQISAAQPAQAKQTISQLKQVSQSLQQTIQSNPFPAMPHDPLFLALSACGNMMTVLKTKTLALAANKIPVSELTSVVQGQSSQVSGSTSDIMNKAQQKLATDTDKIHKFADVDPAHLFMAANLLGPLKRFADMGQGEFGKLLQAKQQLGGLYGNAKSAASKVLSCNCEQLGTAAGQKALAEFNAHAGSAIANSPLDHMQGQINGLKGSIDGLEAETAKLKQMEAKGQALQAQAQRVKAAEEKVKQQSKALHDKAKAGFCDNDLDSMMVSAEGMLPTIDPYAKYQQYVDGLKSQATGMIAQNENMIAGYQTQLSGLKEAAEAQAKAAAGQAATGAEQAAKNAAMGLEPVQALQASIQGLQLVTNSLKNVVQELGSMQSKMSAFDPNALAGNAKDNAMGALARERSNAFSGANASNFTDGQALKQQIADARKQFANCPNYRDQLPSEDALKARLSAYDPGQYAEQMTAERDRLLAHPDLTPQVHELNEVTACVEDHVPSESESNKIIAVSGALCGCQFGNTKSPALAMPVVPIDVNGKPPLQASTVKLLPFGLCSSINNPTVMAAQGAPQPCVPSQAPGFMPLTKVTQYAGEPAIVASSKGSCPFGMPNCISISQHGQPPGIRPVEG